MLIHLFVLIYLGLALLGLAWLGLWFLHGYPQKAAGKTDTIYKTFGLLLNGNSFKEVLPLEKPGRYQTNYN